MTEWVNWEFIPFLLQVHYPSKKQPASRRPLRNDTSISILKRWNVRVFLKKCHKRCNWMFCIQEIKVLFLVLPPPSFTKDIYDKQLQSQNLVFIFHKFQLKLTPTCLCVRMWKNKFKKINLTLPKILPKSETVIFLKWGFHRSHYSKPRRRCRLLAEPYQLCQFPDMGHFK